MDDPKLDLQMLLAIIVFISTGFSEALVFYLRFLQLDFTGVFTLLLYLMSISARFLRFFINE